MSAFFNFQVSFYLKSFARCLISIARSSDCAAAAHHWRSIAAAGGLLRNTPRQARSGQPLQCTY